MGNTLSNLQTPEEYEELNTTELAILVETRAKNELARLREK